ncbi:hypothetical protein HKBW3S42_02308, partial [Candidatus Hakubella thermalkaliphila]
MPLALRKHADQYSDIGFADARVSGCGSACRLRRQKRKRSLKCLIDYKGGMKCEADTDYLTGQRLRPSSRFVETSPTRIP